MPAEYYHFTDRARCEAGVTFNREFKICSTLTDAEKYAVKTGTATEEQQESIDSKTRNFTGCTARMQVRTTVSDPSTVLSLTTENGGITLGGTAGTIRISISATATAALSAGLYYYDLELINGSTVERILQGKFEVDPEVTR